MAPPRGRRVVWGKVGLRDGHFGRRLAHQNGNGVLILGARDTRLCLLRDRLLQLIARLKESGGSATPASADFVQCVALRESRIRYARKGGGDYPDSAY